MLQAHKLIFCLILVLNAFVLGCSSTNEKQEILPVAGVGPTLDENYFKNTRLPANVADGSQPLDPVYMQTQADYHFSVGEALSLEGKADQAIQAFKTSLIYDQKSPRIHLRLSVEFLKQGLVSESIAQAEEAISKDSNYLDAYLLLGSVYSTIKTYPKAILQYEKVLKLDPKNQEAPLYLGAIYAEEKKYDQAIVQLQSLLKNKEYESPHIAHFYIGKIYMEKGTAKEEKLAESAFKKSNEAKPDFVEPILALGALYVKNGKEAQAIEMFKQHAYKNGPTLRVAEILAQHYLEKEQYDLAYDQLGVMEALEEDPINTKVKMALVLIEKKDFNRAIEKLQEVLVAIPDSDKIRFYLAAVYEEVKDFDSAIKHFNLIPVESSFYGESVIHAAYLYKQQMKTDESIAVIKKGIESANSTPQMYSLYASLLDEKKKYNEALNILNIGSKKYPDNAQIQFFIGNMHDRLGEKDKVISSMQKVLELDPDHVQGLNYLAFTFAEAEQNLPDAEKMVRKALEREPNDGYILDTLGWILYKQGKFKEAIPVLEKAHLLVPGESIIAEHLGDAYYKQKNTEKAKKMYLRAVEFAEDKEKIEAIRAKILALEDQRSITVDRVPASIQKPVYSESAK